MDRVTQINVTQLSCACKDPEFLQALKNNPNAKPPFFAPLVDKVEPPLLMGQRFHHLVSGFLSRLAENPGNLISSSGDEIWVSLFEKQADAILTEMAEKGNVEGAGNLAMALKAFCHRLAEIRFRVKNPVSWKEILLAHEFPVNLISFQDGAVLVSGRLDCLRIAQNGEIELVDYKLNSGAKLDADLIQLAIYSRLLRLSHHHLNLNATLEYYEPKLHELQVPLDQLDAIFLTSVEPILTELAHGWSGNEKKRPGANRKSDATASYLIGNRKPNPNGDSSSVFWNVDQSISHPISNFGVFVTGDAGSGKTQILKALISDAAADGHAIMIFDFKNDFAGTFAKECGLTVHDLRYGVPFNPLHPPPNQGGKCQPIEHIYEVTGILAQCLKLGDQQQAVFRDSLSQCFGDLGVPVGDWVDANKIKAPGLGDVINSIEEKGGRSAAGLKNRLGILQGLNLFPSDNEASFTFDALINEQVVLLYSNLPTDPNLKRIMAELILIQAHGYMLRGEQPRKLTRIFAFDEAHRAAESQRLISLAREGRAFGVGIFAGTQFADDLHPDLTGNLATKIHFFNSDGTRRRKIVSQILGSTTGTTAQKMLEDLANLRRFEAIVANPHCQPYVTTVTKPHFQR